MIISSHLPYFIPYPGYFLNILLTDKFVILDNAQFPQGRSWVSRNLLKNDQGKIWITVPVFRKGLGLQIIKHVKIMKEGNWTSKVIQTFEGAYKNSPYVKEHIDFINSVFAKPPDNLIDLNMILLNHVLRSLDIKTEIILLSEMNITAREPELSFLIAKELGASVFLSMSPKKKYLDPTMFERAKIDLMYLHYRPIVYPQLWGSFVPNLSILDLLVNCGPASKRLLEGLKDRCIRRG